MKREITLDEALKIAKIHDLRLQESMKAIKSMVPFTAEKIDSFTVEQRMACDSLIFRFSKLQDLIGQTIMNELLTLMDYDATELSLIDKLNLLEKMNIFDTQRWKELRDLRNHLSHEYPDRPDLLTDFLTQTYEATPELSLYLERIIDKLSKINQVQK